MMKNFTNWQESNKLDGELVRISQADFLEVAAKYFKANLTGNLKTFHEFIDTSLTEAVQSSRYSIEVNYRTNSKEVLENYAKIVLGFVSAALKNHGFHTKHVFTESPLRLLVSSRNWDDGEVAGVIVWHPNHNCFVISKGFYNRDRKTISVQTSKRCEAESAADLAKDMHNLMHQIKSEPDRHTEKLNPVPLKRGPKN